MKPTFDEKLAKDMLFRQTLRAETDRGVALVCAAYLDEELRALLEKTFVNVPNIIGKLFEGTGPLATFSSRIDLAFAIGLLSGESHRALHLIRKIRNDFAHEHRERSFLDQDISARCRELIPLNFFVDETDPRNIYIGPVLTVLSEIQVLTELTQRPEVPTPKPTEGLWNAIAKVRNTVDVLFANMTEEQISRFSSPETNSAETKRLILESLLSVGVDLAET